MKEELIKFDNSYVKLNNEFYQELNPRDQLNPTILYFNDELADELGLKFKDVDKKTLASYFSFHKKIPGSEPVAMVYAGHQFGHFVTQLGDGRAALLGEFIASNHQRYDIHLKGSGKTQFSRRGDGKSALGPSVRECLLSEAMHHLGVPTTRTLCVVRTSEMVLREALLPGGVSTRIALSHLRVGTFEYFAAKGDSANLKILADYAINRLYPELKNSNYQYLNFWKQVFIKQIQLVSKWMSLGFIHGVMNTDNMNISGETIDYGPCAFMDIFSQHKVFSSIDHNGRYAYANQPNMLFWNMARFAESLGTLLEVTYEELIKELDYFQKIFLDDYYQIMVKKFGLSQYQTGDEELIQDWLTFLEKKQLDFTLSYIDLEKFILGEKTYGNLEQWDEFLEIVKRVKARAPNEELLKNMLEVNPMVIPRNHLVDSAIKASIIGNDSLFVDLMNILKHPYQRADKMLKYHLPPKIDEIIKNTFCGT